MNCKNCKQPVPDFAMPDGFEFDCGVDHFYNCPNCGHCFVSGQSLESFTGLDPEPAVTHCTYCEKELVAQNSVLLLNGESACRSCDKARKTRILSEFKVPHLVDPKAVAAALTPKTQPKGKKHDKNKPRWDLVPWNAQAEVVDVLTFGAEKYGDENWRNVPDAKRRYIAALFRHAIAPLRGEKRDSETGKHHWAHAICCLLFLLELSLTDEAD